jgi:hypothetical protein
MTSKNKTKIPKPETKNLTTIKSVFLGNVKVKQTPNVSSSHKKKLTLISIIFVAEIGVNRNFISLVLDLGDLLSHHRLKNKKNKVLDQN